MITPFKDDLFMINKQQLTDYSANTIETHQDLEHIRARPTAYIDDHGTAGIIHMIREYVDNSLDELILKPEGGTIYIGIFRQSNKFQILINDCGRGIPTKSLINVMTKYGTSGKFNLDSAYVASAGSFGIGAKVGAALSNRFRAISSSEIDKAVASIYLVDAKKQDFNVVNEIVPSGTTVMFQPDVEQFFYESSDFAITGYMDLVTLCKQLNILNEKINFQIYVYDYFLPEKIWTDNILDAYNLVQEFLHKRKYEIVYATDKLTDITGLLFEFWKTNSPVIFSEHLVKEVEDREQDRLSFKIHFYLTRRNATVSTQYYVAVNNVYLRDKTENAASVTFMDCIKQRLIERQKTPEYKSFVENDYRFSTLLVALDIRYHGAEFVGATKDSFRDQTFAKKFAKDLNDIFDAKGDDYWNHFADLIFDDIKSKYAQMYNVRDSKSARDNLSVELIRSNKFYDCEDSSDDKELYIVEGTSAGNIIESRLDNQAVYQTQGKPKNGATRLENTTENRKILANTPIYHDILKILHITPNTTDMSVARFKKIFIATDADPDGSHIDILHIHNLWILNPRIIESGMVWLVHPPLYSIDYSREGRAYLCDERSRQTLLIDGVYKPTFDIAIRLRDNSIIVPDDRALTFLYKSITEVGKVYEKVSRISKVPEIILDRLVLGFSLLYPRIEYDSLHQLFVCSEGDDYTKVTCYPDRSMIVVSLGETDYPIELETLIVSIRRFIIPLMVRTHFHEMEFIVSSKNTGSTFNNQTMSAAMLYRVLKEVVSKFFHFSRYKGLGEMPEESCYNTIMNPETRIVTHITSVGDPSLNYAMVGENADMRKQLMCADNSERPILDMSFIRNFNN